MNNQYRTCTRGDYKNSHAHDWRVVKKEEITSKFRLENLNFDGYPDPWVLVSDQPIQSITVTVMRSLTCVKFEVETSRFGQNLLDFDKGST